MQHDWIKSNLGHGEQMCSRCRITNREAAVLNRLNYCDVMPEWMQWKGEGAAPAKWTAINPETNQSTIIYRSYEDYCGD
jgi:hypothetical protein